MIIEHEKLYGPTILSLMISELMEHAWTRAHITEMHKPRVNQKRYVRRMETNTYSFSFHIRTKDKCCTIKVMLPRLIHHRHHL